MVVALPQATLLAVNPEPPVIVNVAEVQVSVVPVSVTATDAVPTVVDIGLMLARWGTPVVLTNSYAPIS
jgi:hypothetical protein